MRGFTYLETIVTVCLLAILTSFALPSYQTALARTRVKQEWQLLHQIILTAQNHAVNEKVTLTLCPIEDALCQNAWGANHQLFEDTNKNRQQEPHERVLWHHQPRDVTIHWQGFPFNNGLQFLREGIILGNGTFTLCDKQKLYCQKLLVRSWGIKANI